MVSSGSSVISATDLISFPQVRSLACSSKYDMYPRRNSEKNDSYYADEDYLISRKMLGNDEAYGDDSYYDDEDYLDMADAVSSNDCTGLLTHGTGLEEELDYYSQLYKFGTSPDE